MSVADLAGVHVPPATAVWIGRVMFVFLVLFILWVVLKVIGLAYRRSYNLTPVATASGKDIKPDFLTVDRNRQKEMLARGAEFGREPSTGLTTAERLTRVGMIVSGLLTLVTAVFLAFGSVEEFDVTWRNLSAKDRFVAIVQAHPVGFTIALAMVLAALIRFTMTLRTAK